MEGICNYIERTKYLLGILDVAQIEKIVSILEKAYLEERRVFIIGNGGSAASASHFACDLGKGTVVDFNSTKKRFNVLALTDNNSLMTAYGNDLGYKYIFSEQLKNFAKKNDILISISASGNSPNIVEAINVGKKIGLFNIGLSGFSGGKVKELSDECIFIPDNHYGRVEDIHMMILHAIACSLKEKIQQNSKD